MTWQAHGDALQIWRAAYAAAYREMLAINHQLEAYAEVPASRTRSSSIPKRERRI